MGALHYLEKHGLTAVPLDKERLEVRPAEALDDELRAWIREHKTELLAELTEPRRRWWRIILDGKPVGKIIGPGPMTEQEALGSLRKTWPCEQIAVTAPAPLTHWRPKT